MNPQRDSSLVEILDRLLNRGAIINADLIITVAGIPLIGLNLRAALASMETMLEYGIMEDWDKSSRELYASQETHLPLIPGEQVLYKAFGYIWQDEGIVKSWVPGIWNVTNERLILWVRTPGKAIFETPLPSLRVFRVPAAHETRQELELVYPEGIARISLSERDEFEAALAEAAGEMIKGAKV